MERHVKCVSYLQSQASLQSRGLQSEAAAQI